MGQIQQYQDIEFYSEIMMNLACRLAKKWHLKFQSEDFIIDRKIKLLNVSFKTLCFLPQLCAKSDLAKLWVHLCFCASCLVVYFQRKMSNQRQKYFWIHVSGVSLCIPVSINDTLTILFESCWNFWLFSMLAMSAVTLLSSAKNACARVWTCRLLGHVETGDSLA